MNIEQMHWMYAFNIEKPPICEVVAAKKDILKDKYTPKNRRSIRIVLTEKQKKKLLEDMQEMLLTSETMNRNADIYYDMQEMGLIPGNGEDIIAKSTFCHYLTIARRIIKPDYYNVKNRIVEIWHEDKEKKLTIADIAKQCGTDKRYVKQTLLRAGLIERKIIRKKNGIS